MNTGMLDSLNLVWKLALWSRLGNKINGNQLLDTYEREHHPIAERDPKTGLYDFKAHGGLMERALRVEENQKAIKIYLNASSSKR